MINRIYTRLHGKGGKIDMRAGRPPATAALPGHPPRVGGWENLVVNTSYARCRIAQKSKDDMICDPSIFSPSA
jgi:hypothetical protein